MEKFNYEKIPVAYYDVVYKKKKGIQSAWHHIKFNFVSSKIKASTYHLDIGCGPGTFLGIHLKEINKIGLDISKNQIDLIVGQDILTTLKSEQKDSIDAKIIYDKPIKAPILKNQEIGKIIIEIKDKDTLEFPLYAKDSIKKINPLFRVFSAIRYLIFGNINND